MKILFVLHYPPPVHGSSMVGLQIKESKFINETFDCKYINLGTSNTINEIGRRKAIKLFRYFKIIWHLLENITLYRPDFCYFSISSKGAAFYKDSLLILIVKLLGIKLIYHFHNKGVSLRQDKFLDDFLYQLVFKNSNVILLSKHLHYDINKYVNKEQVYYCPNGISDINERQVPNEGKTIVDILFLSNLMESKGIFILLEACELLKNKKLPFHCTIVGGIGDISEQYLRSRLLKMDLENCVYYMGKKFGKDKEKVFLDADIFVHPTLDDCFPLVLLEAMQYSLPIVSTFEGGIPDIVDNGTTGYLIDQRNSIDLANKIEVLIKNPELRRQMGNAGKKKYKAEFTIDIFEHKIVEILHQIMRNN